MFREQLRMIQAQLLSSQSQYEYAMRNVGLEEPGPADDEGRGAAPEPYTTWEDTERVSRRPPRLRTATAPRPLTCRAFPRFSFWPSGGASR